LLGKTIKGGQQIYWEFGHKALPNRHMLIFGSSGQGKTYAIQCILCEMIKSRQNSLIIDYTNGFLPNQLEKITIEKLSPKQHVIRHEPLPINPFLPIDSDSGGIRIVENANNVASRISGLFDAVYNIGDQQYSVLHQAIMEGVDSLGSNMNLDEMLNIIEAMTNDKKYKSYAQSLLSKLRPFVLDKPFAHGMKDLIGIPYFLKKILSVIFSASVLGYAFMQTNY
jgi:DNA phosphorothioation-dependent restriction protein DptH